jgi:hypothetical protein
MVSFPAGAYLSDIAVHPEDDDKVLMCFGNYVVHSLWYTEDGGATWMDLETNLGGPDGPSVRCVAIVPGDGADLWLTGTSTGIYSTSWRGSGSVTWVQEAPATIGHTVVDDLMVRQSDRKLVVGTHGRGIFSVTVPEASHVPQARPASLAQNVPNPFNPETEISFILGTAGPARLTVHDLSGRLVRVLFEGQRSAGEFSVSWDGTELGGGPVGSGVYLYRLEAGGKVEQRKMTLVR